MNTKNSMPIYVLVMALLLVMITNSCKKNNPEPQPEIKLGASYQGGIVFYLDASGKHGLIAAANDQSNSDPWWNNSFITTGATSSTDGFGNTNKILQTQGTMGTYAANLCKNYSGGGFHDWFLPAKDQLNTLYNQKTTVGGFNDEIYWSSTEFETGSVWVQNFSTAEQHLDNTSDGANVHTRAIRAF